MLKAGTEQGYFFTQSVVDALRYAGDQQLDVVNMSFFADPWLFNCRNDKEQKAIIKAISDCREVCRSSEASCSWPPPATRASTSTIRRPTRSARTSRPARRSRDRSTTRASSCRTEIPGVVVVTATGAENLLTWYSTYGNVTDVTAPGGSRFQTPTFDTVAWARASRRIPRRRAISTSRPPSGGWSRTRRQLLRLVERNVDGRTARRRRGRADPGGASGHVTWAVVAMLRSTATGRPARPPSIRASSSSGLRCSTAREASGNNNFYGKGLVNALAASHCQDASLHLGRSRIAARRGRPRRPLRHVCRHSSGAQD